MCLRITYRIELAYCLISVVSNLEPIPSYMPFAKLYCSILIKRIDIAAKCHVQTKTGGFLFAHRKEGECRKPTFIWFRLTPAWSLSAMSSALVILDHAFVREQSHAITVRKS